MKKEEKDLYKKYDDLFEEQDRKYYKDAHRETQQEHEDPVFFSRPAYRRDSSGRRSSISGFIIMFVLFIVIFGFNGMGMMIWMFFPIIFFVVVVGTLIRISRK